MRSRYTARESALSEHQDPILSLWSQNLDGMTPPAAHTKLRHGYLANPAGPGLGVLLHDEASGQPVGVQCLHARTFWQDGVAQHVAALADYAVGQAHRSLGPALTLMRTGLGLGAARFGFVYGFPNARSQAVCTRAGMQRVGGTTRYGKLLSSRFLLRSPRRGAWWSWLAGPADGVLRLLDAARTLQHARGLRWSDAAPGDARIDAIWQRRDPRLLLSERSARVLGWRYAPEGFPGWRVSVAEDAHGQPLGYVAWARRDDVVLISDFFCGRPEHDTCRLLTGFARHMRRERASALSLEFYGCDEVARQLRRAGFFAKPGVSPLYVAAGQVRAPADAQAWYVTGFDRDGD